MTGHLVARSVSTERDGKRGETEVERDRRVEMFVLRRNGQEALKRVNDESLSIIGDDERERKEERGEGRGNFVFAEKWPVRAGHLNFFKKKGSQSQLSDYGTD